MGVNMGPCLSLHGMIGGLRSSIHCQAHMPLAARPVVCVPRPSRLHSTNTGHATINLGLVAEQLCPLEEGMRSTPDHCKFWRGVVQKLTKQAAIEAARKLDPGWLAMLSPHFGGSKQPDCFNNIMNAKIVHPCSIILVQKGSGFVTAGVDSVLLLEYCGIKLGKAVPAHRLEEALQRLVRDEGFSVGVVMEVGDRTGCFGAKKYRKLVDHVTPERPFLVYPVNEQQGSGEADVAPPALCGLSMNSHGAVTVMRYAPARCAVLLHEGLTLDAAWGLLNADASSPPVVYIHRPMDVPQPAQAARSIQKHFAGMPCIWRTYDAVDPVQGFKQAVMVARELSADHDVEVAREAVVVDGVSPLYGSTAHELGLLANPRNLPNLLAYLLPEDCRKLQRDTLQGLLLVPPSWWVAAATRQAVSLLMTTHQSLPMVSVKGICTKKLLMVLQKGQGKAAFFRDLQGELEAVVDVLRPDAHSDVQQLARHLWPLLHHTLKLPAGTLQQHKVLEVATYAVDQINEIVALDTEVRRGSGKRRGSNSSGVSSSKHVPPTREQLREDVEGVLQPLRDMKATWRRQVQPEVLPQELLCQHIAAAELLSAVCEQLLHEACGRLVLHKVTFNTQTTPKLTAERMDRGDCAVRIKLARETSRHALAGAELDLSMCSTHKDLQAPQVLQLDTTRRGSKAGNLFICEALEIVTAEYLASAAACNAAASKVLNALCADLAQRQSDLAAALQLGILLSTLLQHSRAARTQQWAVPLVGAREQLAARSSTGSCSGTTTTSSSGGSSAHVAHDGVFELRGLWPYWLSGSAPHTVRNDVGLDGFMLLTGPNMAGKSTVLRAVAGAALAGSVGLAIPAAPGSCLPLLGAVVMRTFSGDAPQEGLSAWGVEMKEMGTVLTDVRPCSLVLVDELGKGTEVVSGTALAAAILEDLVASGAWGMFATHLHMLVEMLKGTPRLREFRMEVVPDSHGTRGSRGRSLLAEAAAAAGAAKMAPALLDAVTVDAASSARLHSLRPTWKLQPGTCFDSLAFAVAADCGMPDPLLQIAVQDYQYMLGGAGLVSSDSHFARSHSSHSSGATGISVISPTFSGSSNDGICKTESSGASTSS